MWSRLPVRTRNEARAMHLNTPLSCISRMAAILAVFQILYGYYMKLQFPLNL